MEQRGVKDPEKVRRQQERARKLEQEEIEAAKQGQGNPNLRVNNLCYLSIDRLILFLLVFSLSFQWQAT